MKKFSLLALAVGSSLAMFAQESVTPMAVKPRFGIKGGVNLAELKESNVPSGFEYNTNMKTSWHAGVFFNAPLGTGGLAIQPELLYSAQGSKITAKTTAGGVTASNTYEQDLKYVTLPIMLQWKSQGGFYLELGPQAGILLTGQTESSSGVETDNKKSFDDFDLSAAAGIGYLSRIGLGIGARYLHGLTNTLETENLTGAMKDFKMRNQVIQIGLSYHFGAAK